MLCPDLDTTLKDTVHSKRTVTIGANSEDGYQEEEESGKSYKEQLRDLGTFKS